MGFGTPPAPSKALQMGVPNPVRKLASRKQLNKILGKLVLLGISNIKGFLESLYMETGSLRKMRDALKAWDVNLRPKDLLILMEFYGISRNNCGEHLNANRKKHVEFNGDDREKLYLWGFCKGDARLECSLTTIRIDVNGKLATVKCIYTALKPYIDPTKQAFKLNNYGYYSFSHSFDKETFNFLLFDIDEISNMVKNIGDLAALLAGLIDSDGTIYIKDRIRVINRRIYRNIEAYIGIINRDLKLLKTLQNLLRKYGVKANIPKSITQFGAHRLRITKRKHLTTLVPLLEQYMKHVEKLSKIRKLKSQLLER